MKLVSILLLFLGLTRALDQVEDDEDDDEEDDTEDDKVGVRSGFEMFKRRLPGSLMLATSANDTGAILGSWSSNAIASTVFEFYQGESVVANGHNFGGWIMGGHNYFMQVQPQMPLKVADGSMHPPTLGDAHEANKGRLDMGLLTTKLWTSAILRDNIVTTFGFILNRPNNPLPADLYASLMLLYNVIRLRRIHTLDLLPVLKKMSYSPPQEQFVVLFEKLHRHVPAYLKSPVSVWIEALTEHRVDLNPIIRPGGGPCEVDFLASLEPQILNVLEEPIFFKRGTVETASTTIKVLMGSLFSYVFAGLYDGSIELTQPIFALILLHLPLDQNVPQKDETERYVVDALRLNAIEHWNEVVATLSEGDILNPFRLVTAVLQGIASNKKIDRQIRHDSLYILPYVKACTSTYANENYAIMSEVIGSPSIKFKLLLDHITWLSQSPELEKLKERLLDYIRNGYIDVETAVTGFIRYDYTTPYDVLIAILSRIQRRLPNLSGEMLGTAEALRIHLVFHKVLSQIPSSFPVKFIQIPSLLDAFSDPGLPIKVKQICKTLSGLVDEEHIDWESLTADMPVTSCTAPRQCFLTIMRKAIKENVIVNNRIVKLLDKVFNLLDENGNVKDSSEAFKCHPTVPTFETLTTTIPVDTIVPKHLSVLSSLPTIFSVLKDTSITTVTPSSYFDDLNTMLPNNASLLEVIPKAPQLQPVVEVIQNKTIPDLHQLNKYFHNKSRAEALLILLESLLHCTQAESNPTLVETIIEYITFLVTNYGLSRIRDPPKVYLFPPPGTEFPAMNPSIFCLWANFEQRESLLPYTTPFSPKDILMKPIRDFITKTNLLSILGNEFKPSEYKTKFLMLQAILQKAVSTQTIQKDYYLNDLLSRYLDFITHQAEVTKPTVNWIAVLDALPHARDDHEYKHFALIRAFIMSSEMKTYITAFEVRRYPTRGQLLQNCFRHLLTLKQIKERPDLSEAIKYFVDKVYLDGFGAKAVEYIIVKEQIIRRTVDLQKAFQAIALNRLDKKASKDLKGVYRFFEKEFQPPIHLANYDLFKHKTKGEWLKAYFTYLVDHPAISKKAKDSISAIIPYILLTGPGADNVD